MLLLYGLRGTGVHCFIDAHSEIRDPTGCGDAYRAGLLYGIANGWDWKQTGSLAAVMGAIKVAHQGCQSHTPSRDEIGERYRKAFGTLPW